MTFTYKNQITSLASRQLSGFPAETGLLFPNYDGYCLSNLPAAVCSWLGAPPLGSAGLAGEYTANFHGDYEKVVFFLIDGMGLGFLERCLGNGDLSGRVPVWNQLAGNGDVFTLTSTSPSTTSSALTSLWTGVTPAEHGVVGYEMWLKEFGLVVNMVNHTPSAFPWDSTGMRRAGFHPERFLPVPTLGSYLALHGVSTRIFQHHTLTHSGLSSMLMEGVEIYPFLTLSEDWWSIWLTTPPQPSPGILGACTGQVSTRNAFYQFPPLADTSRCMGSAPASSSTTLSPTPDFPAC